MNTTLRTIALAAGLMSAASVLANAVVSQPAPQFSAQDATGKTVNLADYKGKYVVLEWLNPGCPFVQKHYNSGNMQALQKDANGKGVVWLSVSSTATSAADYKEPAALGAWMKEKSGQPNAIVQDAEGKIGRAYGARTTPHMYLIDPQGKLIYAGAIDSKASANPEDIKTATNYVSQALTEVLAGKAVSQPTTKAYGCGVKYAG